MRAVEGAVRIYDVNDTEEIVDYLMRSGIDVSQIEKNRIGLEEYYIELMNRKEAV